MGYHKFGYTGFIELTSRDSQS